ncbi:MAG: cyclic lactone autoinducer peptide [Ruminiclostridium sp.]|nr:cyclic lactone autoinducer peptide [Ruminiclostridium sp.]
MKANKIIADFISKIALKSAKIACGAASCYGIYQPKEPADIKERIK